MDLDKVKNIIEERLWAFGFLPLLVVMEVMQEEEEYEICGVILDVLRKHSDKFKIDIPTHFTVGAVMKMKEAFKKNFNLSGNIAYNNNAFYAMEIVLDLEKHIRVGKMNTFNRALHKCLTHKPRKS